ncbi:MAG: NAD(P)-dependent dehydrogenase (short-subunit alcohol dehydrogenase family) [Motiliproteus sp.]|jgi:NAD(P)-dependent dehydrogenase (short-subunit alcohol dehydrogenase family)
MTVAAVALVLGASSGLAQAIIRELMSDADIGSIVAVSRKPAPAHLTSAANPANAPLWIESEYAEPAMAAVVEQLRPFAGRITRVIICHGLLHSDTLWPEKRLEDLNAEALHAVFQANTVVPTLWLKLLHGVLKGKQRCVVVALSARVGSIGDNHLGGWYAYRSSKAALNMMMRTLSIEYARRVKNVKLISFHPGTTDTALSKPFQASVPVDKLFTPEFVAARLCVIMGNAEIDGQLSYLDWDNKAIPW